jgi:type I restriction enzyme S subunit
MSMVKQREKTEVPRLRFPGFRKSWDSIAVSDFFDLAAKAEKTSFFDGDRLLTVKLHCNGVVKNEKSTLTGGANYFTRKAGQFIFSKIDLLNGAFGIVPDALDGFSSSSDVPAYSFNAECSSIFFLNWLKSHYSSLQIERAGTSNTLKRVAPEKFLALAILAPSLAEQQKIADCLTSLDDVIVAQGRKVEALKAHKRGLMQQLFPREGETRPRLRFPEFRNAPEWRDTRLSKLGKLVSGLTYSPDDVRNEGLLVLRSSNVQNGEISLEDNVYVTPDIRGANLSQPNDILICVRNGSKALIGKSALIPDGMPVCTHGAFMTVFRAEVPKFAFQLMQSACFRKQVAADLGATINSINGSQLLRYRFVVPGRDEQKRIADCLSSLDTQIAAETRQLAALKTHKQGLMQQLFPAPEEG